MTRKIACHKEFANTGQVKGQSLTEKRCFSVAEAEISSSWVE